MDGRNIFESRILVLAPVGRDAALLANTLKSAGIQTLICANADSLLGHLREGASAAVVTDEALHAEALGQLTQWLCAQPPWSDMPFVVLTSGGRPSLTTINKAQQLEVLGNVTLLERPARPDTILSSVKAAIRGRVRQYQMRHHQEKLTRVNRDLEQFAYSASHDLQEPLRAVGIYSELLSERYLKVLDDQGKVMLGYLKTGATRMEMLVRDLLAYTHAGSGTDEVECPAGRGQTFPGGARHSEGADPRERRSRHA